MVETDNIMASYYRLINYEPAENRTEFTLNATIAIKLEALHPEKGTKEYSEMIKRQSLVDEYIERTGDDTCEIPPDMLEYLKSLDIRDFVPDN